MQPFPRCTASTSVATSVRFPGYPVILLDLIREGDSVQKTELLHIHMLMFHIRMYFEGITHDEIPTERYNSLEISPIHIYKDKKAHEDALLTLGDEIVSHIHGKKLPVVNYSYEAASLPLVAAEH
jgi:hypothetical protein